MLLEALVNQSPSLLRFAYFNASKSGSGAENLIQWTQAGVKAQGHEAKLFVRRYEWPGSRIKRSLQNIRSGNTHELNAVQYTLQELRDWWQVRKSSHTQHIPYGLHNLLLEKLRRQSSGLNDTFFPSMDSFPDKFWPQSADLWHFHNLHGHFLSIVHLAESSLHRPVVLSPVDHFLATGYCVYPGNCTRYRDACGECPQLHTAYPGISRDRTADLLHTKQRALAASRFYILVHTDYLARFYESTFVGSRPIEHIRYGVDVEIFKPMDRAVCESRFGLESSGRFRLGLLHTRVMDKRKGIPGMLSELAALAEKHPGKLDVLVVGGDSQIALQYATPHLKIETLPFLVSPTDFAVALNTCNVLLYPTRAENLSLTTLSALSCGVPVISTNVGGQPEAVIDGETGLLVPLDQPDLFFKHLDRLLTDPDLYQKLAANTRPFIQKNYTIDLYISNLLDYYDRVLKDFGSNYVN